MNLLLSNPQFRLLWGNLFASNLGGIVFVMASGWLVLTISDSPFWVGAAMGTGGLGLMLFSPVGGVLADSVSRRELVAGSGAVMTLMGLSLAVLVLSHQERLWHILAISFLFGAAGAIRAPAFLALTVDVVGRPRLLRANAVIFVGVSVGGVIAPLLAGGVVSLSGVGWAYTIVAGTNLVGAVLVMGMPKLPGPSQEPAVSGGEARRRQPPWRAFRGGARYVFGTANVRALILMGLVGEGFGWAHISMLPVMARDVLGAGVQGFGYLQTAGFVGLLVSTLVLSGLGDIRKKGRMLVVGAGGFGFLIIVFAASPFFPLSLVLLAAAYSMGAVYEITLSTLVQTVVPDEMRGRVIGFQAFTWGVSAFSGFHTGAIASVLGAPTAIAIGAGFVLAYTIGMVPWAGRLQDPELGGEETA